MNHVAHIGVCTLTVLLITLVRAAIAENYKIDRYTVDGVGVRTHGGSFTLSEPTGQSDAGEMPG
jgi:hypothetical protein